MIPDRRLKKRSIRLAYISCSRRLRATTSDYQNRSHQLQLRLQWNPRETNSDAISIGDDPYMHLVSENSFTGSLYN